MTLKVYSGTLRTAEPRSIGLTLPSPLELGQLRPAENHTDKDQDEECVTRCERCRSFPLVSLVYLALLIDLAYPSCIMARSSCTVSQTGRNGHQVALSVPKSPI